jgi:hypothetical protein
MSAPAGQDTVLSAQTSLTLLYSGISDPSVTPTRAVPGTLFLCTGGPQAGKVFVKQDLGSTTNWTELASGDGDAAPAFSQAFYVDPNTGNDATGKPYRTLAAAFAAAAAFVGPSPGTGAPTFPRAVVIAGPGNYNEPAPTLPFNVSLVGYGQDVTIISNGLNYVGGVNEAGRSDIVMVGITGTGLIVDLSASINTNIRAQLARFSLTWNGGPNYGITEANNFLGHACTFNDITVIDGAVHLYNNQGIFSSLTIEDGPVPTSLPFVELEGGLLQGVVTLTGKAQLTMRGVLNEATPFTGIANGGGVIPTLFSDDVSLPTVGAVVGPLSLQIINDQTVSITTAQSPYQATTEETIFVDATLGPVAVHIPAGQNRNGFPLTIKKTDVSANTVTIVPATGTIEGNPFLLVGVSKQARTILSDGSAAPGNYNIVGGYL